MKIGDLVHRRIYVPESSKDDWGIIVDNVAQSPKRLFRIYWLQQHKFTVHTFSELITMEDWEKIKDVPFTKHKVNEKIVIDTNL